MIHKNNSLDILIPSESTYDFDDTFITTIRNRLRSNIDFSSNNSDLPQERYSFKNEITIDFNIEDSVIDCMVANGCYEVFTSNGIKGTINHLFYTHDPKQFAIDLHERLGNGKNIHVCVAGGNSDTPMKGILVKELENKGFLIGDCDIGGFYGRIGTIFKDHVLLKRTPYGEKEKTQELILRF
jgi:hypothetical protein